MIRFIWYMTIEGGIRAYARQMVCQQFLLDTRRRWERYIIQWTFPIRWLHTSHPHMLCIAFLLYGGVASPNLIPVQTIGVSTEAKLWFWIAAAGNHLETAPASIVCLSCMTRARVWRHQHCPPTWHSAGCDRKYVNVHVRFTIAGEEGARSKQ